MNKIYQSKILVIGGREFSTVCLPEMNIQYTLFQKKDLVTTGQRGNASAIYEFDYENLQACLVLAKKLHTLHCFDAVFSFTENGLLSTGYVAKQLNLPSNCKEYTVSLTKDKFKMREHMSTYGVNNVPYLKTDCIELAESFMRDNQNNIIVKPINGAGSAGVHLVSSKESLENAFEVNSDQHKLLLEAYIEGDEYSVESLSKSGRHEILAVTEKQTSGKPHFVELGHMQPAELAGNKYNEIAKFVNRLLNLIEHETGPCHTEIKIFNDTIYLIETQTRTGGDNIWDMTAITTGADLFAETYAHLLGLPFVRTKPKASNCLVNYIISSPILCENLQVLDGVENIPGVVRIEVEHDILLTKPKLTSSNERAGYIMLAVNSSNQAHQLMQEIKNKI